jgi:hypothetical protein
MSCGSTWPGAREDGCHRPSGHQGDHDSDGKADRQASPVDRPPVDEQLRPPSQLRVEVLGFEIWVEAGFEVKAAILLSDQSDGDQQQAQPGSQPQQRGQGHRQRHGAHPPWGS